MRHVNGEEGGQRHYARPGGTGHCIRACKAHPISSRGWLSIKRVRQVIKLMKLNKELTAEKVVMQTRLCVIGLHTPTRGRSESSDVTETSAPPSFISKQVC